MLKITNIKKSFSAGAKEQINVFNDFSIEIKKGEITAILGANGCGKTTLFNLIGGSIKQDNGDIMIDDLKLNKLKENERAKYIGRVYQNPSQGVSPSLTILENVALADKKGKGFGLNFLIKKNKIEKYTDLVKTLNLGLENQMNTKVKYLSGGQRQSLSLLMAAANNPQLLLLDEHTAALDPKTSKLIMKKTIELVRNNKITTMMISHNLRDAIKYSDRIIMLDKGEIILDVESKSITEAELVKIYNEKNYDEAI